MRTYFSISNLLIYLVDFIVGLVEILILLRIILKLFGANPGAPFVTWIYETTRGLLWPFIGMFPSPVIEGGFIVEFSAIFGLIVYAIIGYLIIELIRYISFTSTNRYAVGTTRTTTVREVR